MNMNAGQLMEKFVEEGHYREFRVSVHLVEQHKKHVYSYLKHSESRRHEYEKFGVIAKFVPKKVYEYDRVELNEFLFNIGVLHKVVTFNKDTILEFSDLNKFIIPKPKKLGVAFNKKGRVQLEEVSESNLEDHLEQFVKIKEKEAIFKLKYEKLKEKMLACPVLQKKEKITHEYGSVYLSENPSKEFNVLKIYEHLGPEFVIEHGQSSSTKINEFIERGTIQLSDINQFRRVVDIQMDFRLMLLEDERRMFEHLNRRRNKMLENLVG